MNSSADITYLIIGFIFLTLSLLSVAITYLTHSNKELHLGRLEKEDLYKKLKEFEDNVVIQKSLNKEHKKIEIIQKLKKSVILSDDDWLCFEVLFNGVYKGYIYHIEERFSSITFAEKKILVLARMQLSFREMAAILGISPNSPRVTWFRFKKKYDIDLNSIRDFARTIKLKN